MLSRLQTYTLISVSLAAIVAQQACSTGRAIQKYRLNGETIDLYAYSKFGHEHIVLKNYRANYKITYILSGNGGRLVLYDNDRAGSYYGIVDSSDGFYNTDVLQKVPKTDTTSSGMLAYEYRNIKYRISSLKNENKIRISNLERALLTEAIKKRIEDRGHGGLKEPIESPALFFVYVPDSLKEAGRK